MLSKWFSPSGGLFYHLKALRFSKSLWSDFRHHLHQVELEWVSQLSPSQRRALILIGGSGGHVQSKRFLESFEKIIHIDIDPHSKFHFQRNHPHIEVEFLKQSAFKGLEIDPDLLDRFPPDQSSWLFSNLLGQMGLHYNEQQTKVLLQNVIEKMAERSWMSFHDLYSTLQPIERLKLGSVYNSWDEVQKDIQRLNIPTLELADHLTNEVFSFSNRKILLWPLTPKQVHFVEVGFTNSDI